MNEKTIEQLRTSGLHQQLGRNFYIAFVASQQGIALSTAAKNIPADKPVGDLWLKLADLAFEGWGKAMGKLSI